jgi:hypothetical protein
MNEVVNIHAPKSDTSKMGIANEVIHPIDVYLRRDNLPQILG